MLSEGYGSQNLSLIISGKMYGFNLIIKELQIFQMGNQLEGRNYDEHGTFQLKVDDKVISRAQLLNSMETYFNQQLWRQVPCNFLNKFSIFPLDHPSRQFYSKVLTSSQKFEKISLKFSDAESRAVGCMVGLAIGDALGASTQFQPFDKHRSYWIANDFKDLQECIERRVLHERHGEIGIWTDDCSMANSMAYSLLLHKYEFNPVHIRYMFHLWLKHGLGNGGRRISIGLGGNISISTSQFTEEQKPYTKIQKRFNSGNGSLMRLGPVPIAYRHNQEQAMKYSGLQSLTTHDGDQAEECCRLMALILVRLMNRKDKQWREELEKAGKDFSSEVKSVVCLARSEKQTKQIYEESAKKYGDSFEDNNPSLEDRNWNWKDPNFTYSEFRADRQPGYIGSYCMDALSMALHIIWNKNSFKECILWAINMGGDCDTVGAIVGQFAGAIYGYNEQMHHLYSGMQDFTKERYEVFLLGAELGKDKGK